MSIRVVVVDDQEMVRAGFAALLGAEPDIDVVATATDGVDGVTVVQRLRPDVVLMDVRMPVLDGIAATRRLLGPDESHPPRVVMLTTFDADDYVYESLRAGASGFLLKDASPRELADAVRLVAAGDALLAPAVTRRVIEQYAATARRTPADPRLSRLTDREREVLLLVAAGRSNSEIADALVLAEQTVKTHVSRIFGKLDLRDRAQAVVLAYESGLVTPGD